MFSFFFYGGVSKYPCLSVISQISPPRIHEQITNTFVLCLHVSVGIKAQGNILRGTTDDETGFRIRKYLSALRDSLTSALSMPHNQAAPWKPQS